MGWHSFKRFRKTWLRGQRCLEDINNFWMAHRPQTMSELYSHLREELQVRLDEAKRVGYGFNLPKEGRSTELSRMSRKLHQNSAVENVAQLIVRARIKLLDVRRFEILSLCLSSRGMPGILRSYFVDVAGLEPAALCLQSRSKFTLAIALVALTISIAS